ncbi:hypothetical protein [Micromonospora sp. NPDC049374]
MTSGAAPSVRLVYGGGPEPGGAAAHPAGSVLAAGRDVTVPAGA